ncbi:putative toxin-antitoxin system, antitoxin component [Leptospira borgpetersenii str. Brem 307]|uniref:Toxin-antitoxin system, antitoxin component n=1 Tax=Leptospira borgpetersenii str. Brem 328 TaxID=1049780 RepID=A0ABC9SE45_LEPBO|nr:putative toxin-antitoxin system, antitoxin component [Leptospira borgpetersenii str. Brem 307]EMN15961.1 putative toxin-antitoxin system, antitoxin component [Leptospira borgpetersenii str. Brem 328]
MSHEQILEEMPDLEPDDLKASLLYASIKIVHAVVLAD